MRCDLLHLLKMLFILLVGALPISIYAQNLVLPAPYVISVVPQFPALEIYRNWAPVLEYLQHATGMRFELKISHSIPEFERDFLQGVPDFVYLNPYHAVMAYQAHHYIPLVRDGKQMLSGVLVVRADSTIKTPKELDQQVIAFPAPNSFGASLYMRALLTREFNITFQPRYVNTHSNAYREVISKQAAAAGGIEATLIKENEAIRSQLRVLYETPQVPSHPWVAHPRVPLKIRTQLQQALLNMQKNSAAANLLKNIQMQLPILADYKRDYAPLERLGLEKFAVVEKAQ